MRGGRWEDGRPHRGSSRATGILSQDSVSGGQGQGLGGRRQHGVLQEGPGFKGQLGGRSFVICTTNWLVNRKTE